MSDIATVGVAVMLDSIDFYGIPPSHRDASRSAQFAIDATVGALHHHQPVDKARCRR